MPIATKFANGARFSSSHISNIKVLMRQLHTYVPEAAAAAFRVGSAVAPESQTACGQDRPNTVGLKCRRHPVALLVRRNNYAIVDAFRQGAEMC